jgi:predicted DNA-binding transcriptional regulator AlpA
MSDTSNEALIPAPQLAGELSISRRTLTKWIDNPSLGFPQPTRINSRLYFSRTAVEEWKVARLLHTREAA